MKKLTLLSAVAFTFALVSCNNTPKEEELPIEEAVEQMTEAVADSSTMVADTTVAVVETITETPAPEAKK